MKKAVIIVIIMAMFAWSVYEFISSSNDTASPESSDFTVEENAADDETNTDEKSTEKKAETVDADEVGLQVGNIAPNFELTTLEGKKVKLSDYRGQRVMVNFWATWCPPCRAEVPDLQKFHETKDITILAVNLTKTESSISDVKTFVREFGVTFPVLLDKNLKVSTEKYQIRPIPTSFMIDANGRIQFKAFGAMNYELMVQEFEKMK